MILQVDPLLMSDRRRGFTLIEMLLVMALIVMIAALVLPALGRSMQGHRLRQSADLVRGQWARARNEAMRTGRTQIFRFQPSGNVYFVQPWYDEQDAIESSDSSSAVTDPFAASPVSSYMTDPYAVGARFEILPDDVFFMSGEILSDLRDQQLETEIAEAGQATGIWSRPILFYPDGTSSTSQVILADQHGDSIIVALRGLTSTSTSSEIVQLTP
jgi:type II secretion system protein H